MLENVFVEGNAKIPKSTVYLKCKLKGDQCDPNV